MNGCELETISLSSFIYLSIWIRGLRTQILLGRFVKDQQHRQGSFGTVSLYVDEKTGEARLQGRSNITRMDG